jgi:hypothetical protein
MSSYQANGDFVPMEEMDREQLLGIIDDFAKNWLAHDGLWFQAVEQSQGMTAAIAADTEAWRRFSPIEARRIKARHGIGDNAGIPGLVKALGYRLYARLNRQEVVEQSANSVIFRMCDCRVQSARQRKGMPLFPCKSVGIVEYSEFARAIDARIQTEMVRCPPDDFNGDYFCAWRFYIES